MLVAALYNVFVSFFPYSHSLFSTITFTEKKATAISVFFYAPLSHNIAALLVLYTIDIVMERFQNLTKRTFRYIPGQYN